MKYELLIEVPGCPVGEILEKDMSENIPVGIYRGTITTGVWFSADQVESDTTMFALVS